jgi:LysR family transcriptional regulator, transcriptional activator of the cysJI operon
LPESKGVARTEGSKATDKILKSHNVSVQIEMEFDNIETVKRAVEIDAGISIVPQFTIAQETAKKTLTPLLRGVAVGRPD